MAVALLPNGHYPSSTLISPSTNRPISPGEAKETVLPKFFCTICCVHLNMPIQALQHLNGKHHAARLASQNKIEQLPGVKRASNTSANQNSIPKKKAKPLPPPQQKLDPKGLMCTDCNLMFNSESQAQLHYNGKKHALAVGTKAAPNFPKVSAVSNTPSQTEGVFRCDYCTISLNSSAQYTQHCNGIKHQLQTGLIKEPPEWWVEQQTTYQDRTSSKPKKSSGLGVGESFKCDACNVCLNSEVVLADHLKSPKHKYKEDIKAGRIKQPFVSTGYANSSLQGKARGKGGGNAASRKPLNYDNENENNKPFSLIRGRGRGRGTASPPTQYGFKKSNPNQAPLGNPRGPSPGGYYANQHNQQYNPPPTGYIPPPMDHRQMPPRQIAPSIDFAADTLDWSNVTQQMEARYKHKTIFTDRTYDSFYG